MTTVTTIATPAAPEADEGALPVTVAEADRMGADMAVRERVSREAVR